MDYEVVFGGNGEDEDLLMKSMDYSDEATADFKESFKSGEDGPAKAKKKMMVFSTLSGLGALAVFGLLVTAVIVAYVACKRRQSKENNTIVANEDGISTNTRETTDGGSINNEAFQNY